MTFWILRIHRAVSDVDIPLGGVVKAGLKINLLSKPSIELVLNQDYRVLKYHSTMIKPNDIYAILEGLAARIYSVARVVICLSTSCVYSRRQVPSLRPIS